MRATILPKAIMLSKAHRASISIMAKGVYYGLSTASEVFIFLLPN